MCHSDTLYECTYNKAMGLTRNRRTTTIVDRAARTASTASGPDRGTRHFLVLVAAIILAGSTMVGFARAERQYAHPTLFDSWQNAYGVFDCQTESWFDPLEAVENPNGIRTRGDGVIYIEPTVESATGDKAQLGLFLDNVGASLNDITLTLADGTTLNEQGAMCSGEEAVLQVMRWDSPHVDTAPSEIRTQGLAETRFLDDQQAFVIALAPLGSTIPAPPSISSLTAGNPSSP